MAMREDPPLVRLDGQVALVTGASRGIGRAMALALGEAGAAVAVCARSHDDVTRVAKEIVDGNGHAVAVRCDLTRRDEVEDMAATVEAALGPVDLLVNNAGQPGPIGLLAATDPDQWWQTLEVNVRGPLYCARAVLPGMLARGHGRIVNVSSGAGFEAWPMLSAYAREQGCVVPAQREHRRRDPRPGSGGLRHQSRLCAHGNDRVGLDLRRTQRRAGIHGMVRQPRGRLRRGACPPGGLPCIRSGRRPFWPQHRRIRRRSANGYPGS